MPEDISKRIAIMGFFRCDPLYQGLSASEKVPPRLEHDTPKTNSTTHTFTTNANITKYKTKTKHTHMPGAD